MTPLVLTYAAFTDEGRGGNPAGVVLEAQSMDESAMLETARAIGYSETAFVSAPSAPGAYDVRYFSPVAEVAFCGQATVALAVALAERGSTGDLVLSTKAGQVGVETSPTPSGMMAALTSVPTSPPPATSTSCSP